MINNLDPCLSIQHKAQKTAVIELVRIPRVCEEGGGGFPFGIAVDQALRKILQIASEPGLRTNDGDRGFDGYAEIRVGPEIRFCLSKGEAPI
jgi:hypothetical protein